VGLLNDEQFRNDLLSQGWDDSTGAGAFVRSGTIPPSHVEPNSPEAQQYVNAAYGVLSYAAEHGDHLNSMHDPDYSGRRGADLSALQQSIGNTALTYMDLISRGDADTSGLWATQDGQEKDINGKPFQYGFDFSKDDRQGLFSYMNGAESDVKNEFFSGVGQWQAGTAGYAFARDQDDPGSESSTFRNIGTVAGAIAEVQGRGDAEDASKGQYTAMATISAVSSVTGTLAGFNPAASAANSLGAYGINEALRYTLPSGNEGPQGAHEQAITTGDIDTRVAVANAAVAADHRGTAELGDDPRRNPNASGYNDTDLSQWAYDVLGQTGYLDTMRDAYKTEQDT
jgi:hypothetical protein